MDTDIFISRQKELNELLPKSKGDLNKMICYLNKQKEFHLLVKEHSIKKREIYREFGQYIKIALKKDYIDKYGIIDYIINEENIGEKINNITDKQCNMLIIWNEK